MGIQSLVKGTFGSKQPKKERPHRDTLNKALSNWRYSSNLTNILHGQRSHSLKLGKRASPKAPPISRLPIEILAIIFECYVRLDGPVLHLTQVNRLWRQVAIASQPLWGRLLLNADAMPPSLRAGSVHACGDEETARQVLLRSGIANLEVTLVLGPQAPTSPEPDVRANLFKTVDPNALSRITFLCIIINPQMTLSLVTASLAGFDLPCLESMMIASAYAIGNLFDPLKALLERIDESSLNLRSVYLENVNRDFLLKASGSRWWTRLARLTIRNETDPIDASLFALSTQLEFLSFSGELGYGPENHDQPIEFPALQWLRIGSISMGALQKLQVPKLHSMVIHTIQGNYPLPAPPHHTLVLPELKIFHVTTVNSSVACIVAPKLETLCLGIPTLKNTDANNILNAIFDGDEKMIKPKHLTLTAPVNDKHLLHALTLLPDLMSLQLDHQIPFRKGFFKPMTPPNSSLGRKGACPKLRCLLLDLRGDGLLSDAMRKLEHESTERNGWAESEVVDIAADCFFRLFDVLKEMKGGLQDPKMIEYGTDAHAIPTEYRQHWLQDFRGKLLKMYRQIIGRLAKMISVIF